LPWETPSETLRYPRRAPRRFRADQILSRARWWNRTTASNLSSTNIIRAVQRKRYWPHLRVHCLSRSGPESHCQYPVDGVPPCTRLKSSPTAPDSAPGRKGLRCHRVFPRLQTRSWCWRALAPPRAPWHRARHSTGKGFGVAMCHAAPDPLPVREGSGVATCHRAHHPAGKDSSVTTCPTAPNPPPGAEGF
jgi:hypothetical protein